MSDSQQQQQTTAHQEHHHHHQQQQVVGGSSNSGVDNQHPLFFDPSQLGLFGPSSHHPHVPRARNDDEAPTGSAALMGEAPDSDDDNAADDHNSAPRRPAAAAADTGSNTTSTNGSISAAATTNAVHGFNQDTTNNNNHTVSTPSAASSSNPSPTRPQQQQQQLQQQQQPHHPNPAARGKDDRLPPGTTILRLRGLPYNTDEEEVKTFFGDAVPATILVVKQGFHRGEGYVTFDTHEECIEAYKRRHTQYLDQRYVELYPSNKDALQIARHEQKMYDEDAKTTVRMLNLPPDANMSLVQGFFGYLGALIQDLTIMQFHGQPTGECFVRFRTQHAASDALEFNHCPFSPQDRRLIEVHQSSLGERDNSLIVARRAARSTLQDHLRRGRTDVSPTEFNQTSARMMDSVSKQTHNPASFHAVPRAHPVIRVDGLTSNVEEIHLANHFARCRIVRNGIHLCVTPDGVPTGHAFIELVSDTDRDNAIRYHDTMIFGCPIAVRNTDWAEVEAIQKTQQLLPPQPWQPPPPPTVSSASRFHGNTGGGDHRHRGGGGRGGFGGGGRGGSGNHHNHHHHQQHKNDALRAPRMPNSSLPTPSGASLLPTPGSSYYPHHHHHHHHAPMAPYPHYYSYAPPPGTEQQHHYAHHHQHHHHHPGVPTTPYGGQHHHHHPAPSSSNPYQHHHHHMAPPPSSWSPAAAQNHPKN